MKKVVTSLCQVGDELFLSHEETSVLRIETLLMKIRSKLAENYLVEIETEESGSHTVRKNINHPRKPDKTYQHSKFHF